MPKKSKTIDLALHFQTAKGITWLVKSGECYGIGKSKAEAENQALAGGLCAKPGKPKHVLTSGITVAKRSLSVPPMLVVGSNQYIRDSLPYVLTQVWDIHLTFSPSKSGTLWCVAVVAVHKSDREVQPVWVHAEGPVIHRAIKDALGLMLAELNVKDRINEHLANRGSLKANVWFDAWLKRLDKISLRNILQLPDAK